MSEEDDFLSRWSRRKRARPTAETEEDVSPPVAEAVEGEVADEPEDMVLERLGLPDPDTLEAGADFRRYLVEGVPQSIRRRALRRLWVSDPILANLDGLNDYDQDFTAAAMTPKVVSTAYQVGKGFVRRSLEAGTEADPEMAEIEANPVDVSLAEEDAGQPGTAVDPLDDDEGEAIVEPAEKTEPQPSHEPLRPRRMRFDVS